MLYRKKSVNNSIKVYKFEGLKGILRRPEMYIGDTSFTGLNNCLFEIVNNSIDEALLGYCTNMNVNYSNTYCTVHDNGRGIPVNFSKNYKKFY
ncbi:hypothetical protein E5P55_00405 [Candidatus Pinguicoccus supinus]|uniref:DNA topoisomerase (ATP-hydrolyzing) n=1 Tax=Candidatus Pinguicoccus supinus TaxID=2529394 RepID=A0A7T0BRQ6_9BACT|nr:hypothetical protein E5P55_00405 [Candidatus Pinguicoccus supinus]